MFHNPQNVVAQAQAGREYMLIYVVFSQFTDLY